MTGASRQNTGLRDVYVVWLLFGLATAAVFETYWRIPPDELWKVHNSGFVGGIGRAFVFISFSPALAALAVLPIVVDRLGDLRADVLGIVAVAFCATEPVVQTPSHLDPKWSNILPVVGVALAVALTTWAGLRGRPEAVRTSPRGDRARLLLGAATLVCAAPYVAAELGFYLDGVPVLGSIFQTGKIVPEPGAGYLHATVHYGHHHGLDGLLLVWSALLLSRLLGGIGRPVLRTLTAAILSLMLVYGWANMLNDLWIEQVVKRGWTDWQVPDVLFPSLSPAWALIIACAAIVYVAFLRPGRLVAGR